MMYMALIYAQDGYHENYDGDLMAETNFTIPDERLRLIFTCCHPWLTNDAQVALTLRTLCGLTTREIARAFLASEATMNQRITRAEPSSRNGEYRRRQTSVGNCANTGRGFKQIPTILRDSCRPVVTRKSSRGGRQDYQTAIKLSKNDAEKAFLTRKMQDLA